MAEFHVELRTRHLPTLRVTEDDLAGLAGEKQSWAMRLLLRVFRPSFVARTPFGDFRKAPAGDPGATTWPLLLVLVAIGAVVVLFLVVRGVLGLFGR